MPRVNRDVERRIAARRERERRRGPTPQYRFAPTVVQEPPETEDSDQAQPSEAPAAATRVDRKTRAAALKSASTTQPPVRSFADYRAEYAYVASDLRRIVLVVGGLLVLLIILSFVLRA